MHRSIPTQFQDQNDQNKSNQGQIKPKLILQIRQLETNFITKLSQTESK